MRKSSATVAKNGNVAKADSYREAWSRVDAAAEHGFFIEAAAIIESIISDRLQSHLVRNHDFPLRTPKGWSYRFTDLIKELRKRIATIDDKNDGCVLRRLDQWRERRNLIVHALVQSDPGEPTISVEGFLTKARQCCLEGRDLARIISAWCKRQQHKR